MYAAFTASFAAVVRQGELLLCPGQPSTTFHSPPWYPSEGARAGFEASLVRVSPRLATSRISISPSERSYSVFADRYYSESGLQSRRAKSGERMSGTDEVVQWTEGYSISGASGTARWTPAPHDARSTRRRPGKHDAKHRVGLCSERISDAARDSQAWLSLIRYFSLAPEVGLRCPSPGCSPQAGCSPHGVRCRQRRASPVLCLAKAAPVAVRAAHACSCLIATQSQALRPSSNSVNPLWGEAARLLDATGSTGKTATRATAGRQQLVAGNERCCNILLALRKAAHRE